MCEGLEGGQRSNGEANVFLVGMESLLCRFGYNRYYPDLITRNLVGNLVRDT